MENLLKRPINCSMEKTISIVKAIVCLHNWIRRRDIGENEYVTPTLIEEDDDSFVPGSWRGCIDNSAFVDITQCGSNNSFCRAMQIREEFCKYFNSEGAIPWQFHHC